MMAHIYQLFIALLPLRSKLRLPENLRKSSSGSYSTRKTVLRTILSYLRLSAKYPPNDGPLHELQHNHTIVLTDIQYQVIKWLEEGINGHLR